MRSDLHARRRTLAAAAWAAATACAPPPARALMSGALPDSPTRRLDRNIADSPYACVASLTGGGVYSAVCITPHHALTAGHVAHHPGSLHLHLNFGGDLTHRYAIKRALQAPAPAGVRTPLPVGDLALLEIDGRLPEQLALPPLARTAAHEGLRLEMAGYGASGHGDRGVTVGSNPALKRSGANRIDQVLHSTDAHATPLVYLFSFDAPPPAPRRGKSLGNAVETGLASGDSGSGAFVHEDGRLALLGINTFVVRDGPAPQGAASAAGISHGFGTVCGGQAIAAYRPWLLSVLAHEAWSGLA